MLALDPRPDPGKWPAVALTVLMHALLVAALFFGVRWQNRGPESVEVEVWRASPPAPVAPAPTPVVEAPKPVVAPPPPRRIEPPPPPPKPEIAVKPDKPEPKKPEVKKPEPRPPEVVRPNHDDALKRELAQLNRDKSVIEQQLKAEQEASVAQKVQADAAAAARARGLADYVGSIKGKIRGNVVLPPAIVGNPEAVFEVVQLPTGDVLSVKLKKSSGNAALDAAIERAILKSSPLPKPKQPELFQRVLELHYRPVEES